jgi:nickel/cobalt exporter
VDRDLLYSIAVTGFSVAALHAAIPTHWLPVVLAARAQRWTPARTLGITVLVGGGHVLLTAVLGVVIVGLGTMLHLEGPTLTWLGTLPLVLLGALYIYRQLKGQRHHHLYSGHCHHEDGEDTCQKAPARTSDWAAIGSLFALFTFSPCEAFLPIYTAGMALGWQGFLLLTAVLTVATLAGMVGFTALALFGINRLKLEFLERHENGLIGALLVLLGILNFFHEHH